MLKKLAVVTFAVTVIALATVAGAQEKSPGAGPVIVLETVKGTIEFETYPEEAPKTVYLPSSSGAARRRMKNWLSAAALSVPG